MAPRATTAPRLARATLLLVIAGLAAATLHGCAAPGEPELQAARTAYDTGQYSEALAKASAAQAARDAETAAQAAYIAGLAAFRLDRLGEAERHLRVAAASTDRAVAGRAEAQLGAIQLRQRLPRDAAASYQRAADLLDGEESAKARLQAGLALRQAGDGTSARSQMLIAADSSRGSVAPTVRADAQRALAETGWTLQGGCFRDRRNADRAAQHISTMTIDRGLGPVRVVPQRDSGSGTVYCIFIGAWATRQGAEDARKQLGRPDFFARTIGGD